MRVRYTIHLGLHDAHHVELGGAAVEAALAHAFPSGYSAFRGWGGWEHDGLQQEPTLAVIVYGTPEDRHRIRDAARTIAAELDQHSVLLVSDPVRFEAITTTTTDSEGSLCTT